MLIHKKFQDAANKFPDKPCLQYKKADKYKILTYKDVETQALEIANFLKSSNIEPPGAVCLLSENRYEWPIIYLGIIFSGATAVPVDPQVKKRELENILKDSDSKIIFISENIYNDLLPAFKDIESRVLKIVIIGKEITQEKYFNLEKIFAGYGPLKEIPEIKSSHIASILYTSGTTSNPKAVCLSHYNFCSDAENILKLKFHNSNDNYIVILPLYHTYAFMATIIIPLFSGSRITFISSINTKEIISTIKETDTTIMVGVPQIFNLIHKSIFEKIKSQGIFTETLFGILLNLSAFLTINFKLNLGKIFFAKIHNALGKSLKILNSGGAKLDEKIYSDFNKLGFNFLNGYGLTETSPVVTLLLPGEFKPGSVGRPIPNVEIKIDSPNAKGIGEILIKGPNVMRGYFKRQDLTDEVIKDGWFYSGDLGHIDKHGYLYLIARKKEVIVLSSGKNIYPDEIETLLLESPYIKEACVFSTTGGNFTQHQGQLYEVLHAAVVPNLDFFKEQKVINIKEKIRWELDNFSKQLPSYKHIMSFSIEKDAIPRTHLGKIKRYLVKDNYESAKLLANEQIHLKSRQPSEREISQLSETEKQIINFLSIQLKKQVSLTDHLELDLGIDSLMRVELFLALEKEVGISLAENFSIEIFTVNELVAKIEELKNKISTIKKPQDKSSWQDILNKNLQKNMLQKIKLNQPKLEKTVYLIATGALYVIFKFFWKLKVKGEENLPKDGPYIICPNHASFLDGPVIGASIPAQIRLNAFFFGLTAYFENKMISWLDKFLKIIPIDPATNLTAAMQAASFVLKNNKIMCIFPEGQRSIGENLGEFKKGVGILAKELNVSLVPVYIKGSHLSWPRGEKFPKFCKLTVIFGKPLTWQELKQNITEANIDEYQIIANGLRKEVKKLKTPD